MEYRWNCTNPPNVDHLMSMVDDALEISRQTFILHVKQSKLNELFPDYCKRKDQGLTMRDDWHISYHRSMYNKQRCYFLVHSAIEYVFY